MRHAILRPSAPLDRFVEFLWVAEGYRAQAPRERVLPTGAQALIVHLADDPLRFYAGEQASEATEARGAIVCGARQRPLIIGTQMGATAGVHFRPGGARLFFDVPADAVAEQAVGLEALWGPAGRTLTERLREVPTAPGRLRLLEAALLERVRGALGPSPALALALEAFDDPDLPSVAEVNRRTGLSPKRLLALFRAEIGLSPKAFWRVRRFRAALHDLERGGRGGAALAHEHGYCDQAHFLREFRALAGSSPREYLAARVVGTDHVSVHG